MGARMMAAGLVAALAACSTPGPAAEDTTHLRPAFHFTPERNWMNDPNGLVFYDGEYHLFYQHNPFGNRWGHMSWGHAVSPDLVRWDHLPVALAEEDGVMVFSGSAVVDWNDTTGFGTNDEPPLVAVYTGHYTERPLQNQHLAYSTDRGRTWTNYAGNPVLDVGAKDFRDPKVIWHQETGRWVMVVAMPTERRVRFYASPDLKSWTQVGEFGPSGSVTGIWECPDLFPLTVEGTSETKWVLIVSLGSDAIAGGSGMQYFVGSFDGRAFVADDLETTSWVDFGPDFYAAVSWSDVPRSDGRRLWIGWMSNWQYAQEAPTSPWRSAMSIPRTLSLALVDGRLRLVQTPVRELHQLRGRHQHVEGIGLESLTIGTFELEAILEPSDDAIVTFAVGKGDGAQTLIRADIAERRLTVDRSRSGETGFHDAFARPYHAPIRLVDGRLTLRMFVDRSSIETFVNGGETVMTTLVFPPAGANGVDVTVSRGTAALTVDVWELDAAPAATGIRPWQAPAP